MTEPQLVERARALHFSTLVIDGLQAAPMTPEHFDRLRRGGINVVNYTAIKVTSDFAAAALDIAALLKTVERYSDQVMLVLGSKDIQRARDTGKVGLIIGSQNGRPLMENLDYVRLLHMLGVRILQLTYNERNFIGDGCVEKANGGLSRFGCQVVKEMNRVGILVDLSHCGERTTLDAIEVSDRPVAITHAMAKAITPNPRNKSDDVLRALAAKDGVIGVAFWGPLVYRDPNKRPTLDDFFVHVDHMVEHIGIDHVAIGSDLGEGESREYYEAMFLRGGGLYPEITQALGEWYTFDSRMVEGLDSATCFPVITEGLLRRGYREEDIRNILGGNWVRLMTQVFDT
jgi:membrane dipeptidase